jgi:DNA-binding response OmpR family regulator
LPKYEGATLNEACVRAALQRNKPAMTRILVVENDASVGTAIRMMLSREGCDAIHAEDAESWMRAFVSSRFDLAIVDIFLGETSGLRTIAEFRQRAPTVPVLAMSGFRFRVDGSRLGLSCDGHPSWCRACLRKPFVPHQLMAAVHATSLRHLQRRHCRSRDQEGTMTLDEYRFAIPSSRSQFGPAVEKLSQLQKELVLEAVNRRWMMRAPA